MSLFANSGNVSKFIVSVVGAATVALQTDFGSSNWAPIVVAVLTALTVYLVPNTTPAAQLADEEADVEQVVELALKQGEADPAERVAALAAKQHA